MSIQRLRTRYGEREALELVMKSPDLFDNEQDKEFMKRHLPPGNFDMSGQIPNMASEAFIATQDMDFLIVAQRQPTTNLSHPTIRWRCEITLSPST